MLSRLGFTLVELAIVLVIVGLLVGGVLVGQEMVRGAAINGQIADFRKIEAATQAFRGKYNCIPGDCPNIGLFFTTNYCLIDNGNGNGYVQAENDPHPLSLSTETAWFMNELIAAQLVPGLKQYDICAGGAVLGVNVAVGKAGGGFIATSIEYRNGFFWGLDRSYDATYAASIGADRSNLNAVSTIGVISPQQAWNLDSKMDDGMPTSGKVYSVWRYGGDVRFYPDAAMNNLGPTLRESTCAKGSTPFPYDVTNPNRVCRLFVGASF